MEQHHSAPAPQEEAASFASRTPLVTIDGSTSRDLDDAISIERTDTGYRVFVAIANPSRSVSPGSTEDEVARRLGASVYAGSHTLEHMLPRRISEDECSLIAGKNRDAIGITVMLSKDLDVLDTDITPQRIKVAHRLSYDQVPAILADSGHALNEMLGTAATMAHMLLHKRRQNGALALYDLSRLLLTDEEGRLVRLEKKEDTAGQVIVQEMMILANSVVAGFMVDRNVTGIFRNHEPRASAPAAKDLASAIEGWMAGGLGDIEAVRDKFQAVIGRANYAANVLGHYALAAPHYVHFTSPLRRYADLVNMRQLIAHLKGEHAPYSQEDLASIAANLNETLERRRDERAEGFKKSVQNVASNALAKGNLSRLAEHELVEAIKIGGAIGDLRPVLVDELVTRLERETISDKVAHALMTRVQPADLPDSLKTALHHWLRVVPSRAENLVHHCSQVQMVKDLKVDSQGEASNFTSTVSFTVKDSSAYTGQGTGSRKRDAEQMAIARALAQWLGVEYQEANIPTPVKGNPKGQLLELAQQRGWPTPVFDVSSHGPSHAMRHTCTVTMSVNGRDMSAQWSDGSTKKDAEGRAAQALLERLNVSVQAAPPTVAESRPVQAAALVATVEGNPKGSLLEMCQKRGWETPTFTASSEGPSHAPRFNCTVTLAAHGRTMKASADNAGSKKVAEALAAQSLLQELQTMEKSVHAAPSPQPVTVSNPVGALQEIAQKSRQPAPQYVVEMVREHPPLFKAKVTTHHDGPAEFDGQGASKQEAKAQAATAALATHLGAVAHRTVAALQGHAPKP